MTPSGRDWLPASQLRTRSRVAQAVKGFLCELRSGSQPLLERAAKACFDPRQSVQSTRARGQRTGASQAGQTSLAQAELRRMLFPLQHALRSQSSRALRDLPSQRGAAESAATAAARVPSGASLARCVGISIRAGTGRSARLAVWPWPGPATPGGIRSQRSGGILNARTSKLSA